MKLNEFNEAYEEYTLTEEYYLEEGLKFFKKSKRLYGYAERINKKLIKAEKKSPASSTEITQLKKLAKEITRLADEYKVIEDDFSKGATDKKLSQAKIKRVNLKNQQLVVKLKKNEIKQLFKKVGLGALIIGLGAVLVQLGLSPKIAGIISSSTKTTASSFALRGSP